VCATELELESKYKEAAGKSQKAKIQLKWQLAHGCFHHGLAHYCVRVTRWCGKGQATHPCKAEAAMTNDSDENSSSQTAGRRLLKDSFPETLNMPVPSDTVAASRKAIEQAAWPQREKCFQHKNKSLCAIVNDWLRHPGMDQEGRQHGSLPSEAFLPQRITLTTE
jgi:hypothetical protein